MTPFKKNLSERKEQVILLKDFHETSPLVSPLGHPELLHPLVLLSREEKTTTLLLYYLAKS